MLDSASFNAPYFSTNLVSTGKRDEHGKGSTESVLFVHGFLSSLSMWAETIFPNLSEMGKQKLRLIAVDLLGFGKSPKPANCMYRLRDHLEMIEESVVTPLQLSSYHIVAHSMGCIIALALAAKHPESIKSLTLVAPVSSISEVLMKHYSSFALS